jgi:2-polyprenyl-6-methoxyphenol hydroxylase-like FAD-dependent oxidoreductase
MVATETATTETAVLIVGAGPVGLTAAAALAHLGIACRVIDKNPQPVAESRALGVQARTLELLERLGLVEPFLAEGVIAQHGRIHLDGQEKIRLDFSHLESPYPCVLLLEQSRTERILGQHVASQGVAIDRSTELLALLQDPAGVNCRLRRADGREETCRAQYVLGCDGAHSAVRKQVGLEFAGEAFPGAFLLADVHLGCNWPHDEVRVYTGQRGFLAAFPISGSRWRIVSRLPDEIEPPAQATIELLSKLCAEQGPPDMRPHDPLWLNIFRISSRVVARFREGRVFLAGDAAHIHSPAGGQGMNTGMQDALNLTWKLALTLRGRGGQRLLDSYDAERRPNAEQLVRATERATRAMTGHGVAATVLRHGALTLLGKLEFVRERIATEMSELEIHYRQSPICGEHTQGLQEWLHGEDDAPHPRIKDCLDFAGGPHPGDRAPDAEGLCRSPGDSRRLFQEWRKDLRHQLLIFAGLSFQRRRLAQLEAFVQQVNSAGTGLINATLIRCGLGKPMPGRVLYDTQALAHSRYGARQECLYLVRPDGYVGFRSQPVDLPALERHLRGLCDLGCSCFAAAEAGGTARSPEVELAGV